MTTPTLRPYDPDRKPAPKQWEGDMRQVHRYDGLVVQAVYPDGEPVPDGIILLLTTSGIVRCTSINPTLGLQLESDGRIVDATFGSGTARISDLEAENAALRAQLAEKSPGPVLTLGPVEQELPFGIPHVWWNPDVKKWSLATTRVNYLPCRRILGLDKVPPPDANPVDSPPPPPENPAMTPPPGATGAIWLGPEQDGCDTVPHFWRHVIDGLRLTCTSTSGSHRCRPILNPEVLR